MKISFWDVTNQVERKLIEDNYSMDTVRHYKKEWENFGDYLKRHNSSMLSFDNLNLYFIEKFHIEYTPYGKMPNSKCRRTRRSLQILIEYHINGVILRKLPAKEHVWPDAFKDVAVDFIKDLEQKVSRKTVRQYRMRLELFLSFLEKEQCTEYNLITFETIKSFLKIRSTLQKTTRTYDAYFLRKFFDYLYDKGLTVVDMSVFVPNIKGNNRGKIPSFYTYAEITKLLNSVDRANPMGKRDYAILLLAVRYGMRSDDIRSLELSAFDWTNKNFSFIEKKSSKLVEFPLLNDVQVAIADYLKNGRPSKSKTCSRNVFVRHNAPYCAFAADNNLHSIVSKYMKRAGISSFNYRKHGIHSLRHAIAGNMLKEGVPLSTIAEILSHSSTETTMIYTKIDLTQLQSCALEVL